MINRLVYYALSIWRLMTGVSRPLFLIAFFLRIVPARREKITLRGSRLEFWVRSPMDIWSIKETFLDRFYLRSGIKLDDGWIIIDIGAGIGDFAIQAAHLFPGSRVYAFEPFPESFALLQENLRLNRIHNVLASPTAVAARAGKITLDLSGGEPLQIQSHNPLHPTSGETLEVPSQSLTDLFASQGIHRCQLLKLDCEGAEYSILMDDSQAWLPKVERISMEYHDLPSDSHRDLVDFLSMNGFVVSTFPNRVHAHLGYLYALRKGLS